MTTGTLYVINLRTYTTATIPKCSIQSIQYNTVGTSSVLRDYIAIVPGFNNDKKQYKVFGKPDEVYVNWSEGYANLWSNKLSDKEAYTLISNEIQAIYNNEIEKLTTVIDGYKNANEILSMIPQKIGL